MPCLKKSSLLLMILTKHWGRYVLSSRYQHTSFHISIARLGTKMNWVAVHATRTIHHFAFIWATCPSSVLMLLTFARDLYTTCHGPNWKKKTRSINRIQCFLWPFLQYLCLWSTSKRMLLVLHWLNLLLRPCYEHCTLSQAGWWEKGESLKQSKCLRKLKVAMLNILLE